MLEHPAAAKFRTHVMDGEWDKAEQDLQELKPLLECPLNITVRPEIWCHSHSHIFIFFCVQKMRFCLLEQKYLEALESGRVMDALNCLRQQLSPLKYTIDRVHELSSYVLISFIIRSTHSFIFTDTSCAATRLHYVRWPSGKAKA